MSEEQQSEKGTRAIYFGDATEGIPTMKEDFEQQQAQKRQEQEGQAQERLEAFGKDLQAVIEKHNADMHFAATDSDILAEYVLSVIAVFKFASQSRDYRLFQRMGKAAAAGKLDSLNPT